MWQMSLPAWEFVVRGAVVYVFLLIILRLTGKRQVGQLAPFDLILLLVLSNALQNSMNGGDNSVAGGMILAATLIALNWIVAFATFRSKRLEGLIEGKPIILVHNGHVDLRAMKEACLTHHELNSALRAEGHAGVESVRIAVLENTGKISVIGK